MNEQREMENTDPTKQNLAKCIALADYRFTNDGTIEELHAQIQEAIQNFDI
jgi:dephospho-CoA kinase